MKNPFHEIEQTIQEEAMDSGEAVRALLATIHLECCEGCGSKLRSEEFLLAFQHMLKEFKLCRQLAKKNAA